MKKAATAEAAAGLPPAPSIDVGAGEDAVEEPAPAYMQLFLSSGLPPEVATALAVLPPPGPGDATPEERGALLRGALPAGALPAPAALPHVDAWIVSSSVSCEAKAANNAVRLLRVRWPARRCSDARLRTPPSSRPALPARPLTLLLAALNAQPQAVPGVWVRKRVLREALAGRHASSDALLARIGGRRLGPYEVLLSKGERCRNYVLLRPAAAAAAADLPPAPAAEELTSAAAAVPAATAPALNHPDAPPADAPFPSDEDSDGASALEGGGGASG